MTNIIALSSKRQLAKPAHNLDEKHASKINPSFVKSKNPNAKKGGGCNWWSVQPSGNYVNDCNTGRILAEEYLQYVTTGPALPLQWILESMMANANDTKKITGIEVGFFGAIGRAAAVGAMVLTNLDGDLSKLQHI